MPTLVLFDDRHIVDCPHPFSSHLLNVSWAGWWVGGGPEEREGGRVSPQFQVRHQVDIEVNTCRDDAPDSLTQRNRLP
jgi:hypothetical protein